MFDRVMEVKDARFGRRLASSSQGCVQRSHLQTARRITAMGIRSVMIAGDNLVGRFWIGASRPLGKAGPSPSYGESRNRLQVASTGSACAIPTTVAGVRFPGELRR